MKIVLTGASSFTGFWFAAALFENKHHVTVLLRRGPEEYQSGMRKLRVEKLKAYATEIVYNCAFGSEKFLDSLKDREPFDLFCHHAADVKNYKSADFDFAAALASNTKEIKSLLEILQKQKCSRILLTGSVFEQREGLSSDGKNALSPYGLSKGLTSDVFRYFTQLYGFKLGKFVIPNPFGPLEEEERFTSYLARRWLREEKAEVAFPYYVRDNIPVQLLAASYASFAEALTPESGYCKFNPSYSPAPQSYFIQQFANEMRKRFSRPCEYVLRNQIHFPEPKVRINCDLLAPQKFIKWDESKFWDSLANFYIEYLL